MQTRILAAAGMVVAFHPALRGVPEYASQTSGSSQREASLWGRITSLYKPSQPAEGDVQLPLDKLVCRLPRRKDLPYKPVVLVSCGSFNPPTVLHLRMFELAAQHLSEAGYSVLGGYMSPVNDAYGKPGLLPAQHRIAMAQAAVESTSLVMVDPWEALQPGYQRTLLVLRRIAQALEQALGHERFADGPPQEPVRVMLLCGSDLVETFVKPGIWKPEQLRQILNDHGVVCVSRNAANLKSLEQQQQAVLGESAGNIILIQEPIVNEVSASLVRHELSQGHSVKYLTTDSVIEYIKKHNLYEREEQRSAPSS